MSESLKKSEAIGPVGEKGCYSSHLYTLMGYEQAKLTNERGHITPQLINSQHSPFPSSVPCLTITLSCGTN